CAQAGRIDQAKGNSVQIHYLFNGVAGRTRLFTYNRAGKTEESIEQAGFSSVGRAINHHPHAFAKNPALLRLPNALLDSCPNRMEASQKRRAHIWLDVFLWEIDVGLKIRDQRNQLLPELRNFLSKAAFELFGGGT